MSYRQRRLARQKALALKQKAVEKGNNENENENENVNENENENEINRTVIPLVLKTDVDGSIQVRDVREWSENMVLVVIDDSTM